MTQEEFFKRYTYSPSRDRIGGGGFGTVYKAYDNLLHREVAIKVSEVKTTADGTKTFSLKDEFEALAHVPKHPNIANYEEFYSFEMPNGIFDYAVMQYYPDGNLSNAIKQGLTAEQKEDIATQLLEGIDFLHKHKVVHRDLKPGNILIVKHGGKVIPLITDFGLSKTAGVVDGSVFSNSFGGGTQRYSSPEQLQGKPLRFNTDLWSYGSILYELFTGTQLFTAGSGAANTAQADLEIYNKIVNGDVRNLGGMPEKWRKVAERCLVVDPTKRAKDEAELFSIILGEAQEDETMANTGGSGGFAIRPEGNGDLRSPAEDEGTFVNGALKKREPKRQEPKKIKPMAKTELKVEGVNTKSKKGLWIGLGVAAVAAIVTFLFLWQPKPVPVDPETEEYLACQTIADYRTYLSNYGRNAVHYAEAQHTIDSLMTDSIRLAEADAIALAMHVEDSIYANCLTINACDIYLKDYPQGRYVEEVKAKREELERIVTSGIFSISASKKVRFSKGNLQYQALTGKWRFALHPWDIIGEANSNISDTYGDWIDLFGWGTGDEPTKTHTSVADCSPDGYAFAIGIKPDAPPDSAYFSFTDWGRKYGGGWRTLKGSEWSFIFDSRNTTSGLRYALATVNSVHGVILLPDDWDASTFRLRNTNHKDVGFDGNMISATIWNSVFVPAGAVFLPAAGVRYGETVYFVNSLGCYWSSTTSSTPSGASCGSADYVYFGERGAIGGRSKGQSVRLVRDVQ